MNKNRARFVELALQRFISGKYSASKAAIITGYKRSYIYFLAKRYKRMGFKALIHKSTNRPPANKTNAKTESKIIDLYQLWLSSTIISLLWQAASEAVSGL